VSIEGIASPSPISIASRNEDDYEPDAKQAQVVDLPEVDHRYVPLVCPPHLSSLSVSPRLP
jgi:hypothetical protein